MIVSKPGALVHRALQVFGRSGRRCKKLHKTQWERACSRWHHCDVPA
jgi:hypothetical protein